MDALSDLVAFMRTGRPVSARISWRAPWAQAFPPAPGSAAFHVVLRGSCWLIPPQGAPLPLSVGDVAFLPHGGGYALADHPDTPVPPPACGPFEDRELFASAAFEGDGAETVVLCCGYRLDPGRAHPILAGLTEVIHLPATLGRHPELKAAVELLTAEIDDPRPGTDAVVTSLLETLQLYILRAWSATAGEACAHTGWAAALADPVVSKALDAIHRDPARRWTVESLGACAGMSRAAFARRFTSLVGRPPLAYLTWWRLATAARMLRESDASVAEVAARVGYGSEFAFSAAFKREYGLPPGRYRRHSCARHAPVDVPSPSRPPGGAVTAREAHPEGDGRDAPQAGGAPKGRRVVSVP